MKKNAAKNYTIKFIIASLIAISLILCIGLLFTGYIKSKNSTTYTPVFEKSNTIRIVIDPGHGGEDAGAVASDGTLEKDLNLEISLLLKSIFELNGNNVILTREEDYLLYDKFGDLEDYTGKKKIYDLKNRLKIATETENSIYVGIHMNKFPQEKYSGLQVYYSPNNELSYHIASSIKDTIKSNLQQQNNREIKRADSSIYILNGAKIPSVLVECGFLSNMEELSKLKDQNYQKDLALCLFSSLAKYT